MNKWFLSIAGLVLVSVILLNTRLSRERKFDRTVSYSPQTFRPYDTRFFFLTLKKHRKLERTARAPGGTTFSGTGKTYVVCSPYFLPDRRERAAILRFVAQGNTLLLSSFEIEPRFLRTLTLSSRAFTKPREATDDSLQITWKNGKTWTYPGSAAAPRLLLSSSHPAEITASDGHGFPALIKMKYGEGTVLIQVQPMALSNYFLLHKNNATYLDHLLEEMEGTGVIWDDYYTTLGQSSDRSARRDPPPPQGKTFFSDLVKKHPPLQWAVFTALAGTLLFVINYARRMRQPVEQLPKTRNDSMAFSAAIADLHRRRKDNTAIARKIRLHLLDHLYHTYRIQARELIPENVSAISQKTGKSPDEVLRLTETLPLLREKVSDRTLTEFYRLVYTFIYQ